MASTHLAAEATLFERVAQIIESARHHVARSVNTAMVHGYWLIGREIVEVEQGGADRAEYGEQVLQRLSGRLAERFGRGFSVQNVRRMRQFYLTYQHGSLVPEEVGGPGKRSALPSVSEDSAIRSAVPSVFTSEAGWLFPPLLGWTHYVILMRVDSPDARAFYEIEASRCHWSTRELERQIASLLFERLAKSRNKDEVLALATQGQQISQPRDVIKDPMVLEFLELQERPAWLERDLEQAIIERIEEFILELGKGFCFVARQKRITLEGDHFRVDLIFYNRLLRCFVLIDLELGKLTHQDLGQMQMYVNYFDRYEREEWEAPAVGIVLCSDKNDAMVRITLPEDNAQVLASRYQLYLPTEEELRTELEREREQAEQALRLGDTDENAG